MKKLKAIIAAVMVTLTAATMAACNQITQGEVYDKEYIAAHYETRIDHERIWNGEKYITIPVTKSEWVSDKYYIYIRRERDKGEFDKACYTVGKEKYDSIKIGDEVSFE